jgi:SIR2-like domain
MQNGSIGRLYSILKGQPRPLLLLGAGASLRSGIPTASGVVERAARWAYAHEYGRSEDDPRLQRSDWFPWLQGHSWYDRQSAFVDNYPSVVEHLLQPRHARAEFFRKLLSPGIGPSVGYDKLAEFLHLGFIHTVLTTNFDALLTEMRTLKGRPHFINVIQTSSDYTKFTTSPSYPQLVYLHGSVDHYTDKNLIQEVQRLDPKLVRMLSPLLRDHPLIVVGYRGAEPSVMEHLLIENAESSNFYRHGIFWCRRTTERDLPLPPLVTQLAETIGPNFTAIDIEGFDELFARDLWALNQDSESSFESSITTSPPFVSPTFDMEPSGAGLDELDWSTLRTRIVQYAKTLEISIPAQVERAWITEQLFHLNLAVRDSNGPRMTKAGLLLFGKRPQDEILASKTRVTAVGNPEWLNAASGRATSEGSSTFENVVEGNLWEQFEKITEFVGAFNRAFRLKGETSESVVPYPPLALKEIIVNALVHRDYRANEPILIEITSTSIKVFNRGGLVEEVRHRVEAGSIETEIRRGRRGIKGYRNPVLADLFYGSGEMDKAGSGLSDVLRDVRNNGGDVRFGPDVDNSSFEVEIFSRPEAVDKTTGTASPLVATTSRYVANVIEVSHLPSQMFHAGITARHVSQIWKQLPDQWIPPFLLIDRRVFSFYDPEARDNPLSQLLEGGDQETIDTEEFSSSAEGSRRLVQLLNLSFEAHLYHLGLVVDKKRKRAYFRRTEEGPRSITYQARLRRATRTVVKARVSKRTTKVLYWEHEAFGYRFERLGDTWGLLIDPGYVFSFDGFKGLLAPERVNRLSTQRAARDYNNAVLNDLSFWLWFISGAEPGSFDLRTGPPLREGAPSEKAECTSTPVISLVSKLPVVAVTDSTLLDEMLPPVEEGEADEELLAELERLAELYQDTQDGEKHADPS